ncbi:MAG: Isoleucyl-tRNA synthetase, partial [Marmoricola sp.]|nr:Isoleucyl-tRNA synthetase [Marmoricola sp.]
RLASDGPELNDALALVWTTTPWTLPSNLAVAVNPDVDYVLLAANGEKYVIAAARVAA